MSCTREDVRTDSIAKVRQLIKGDAKAVTLKGNTAVIDYGPQYRIKDKRAAYNFALKRIDKVNKWAAETFGKKFATGWLTLDTTSLTDRVQLHITFPNYLNEAYKVKKNEESLEQANNNLEAPDHVIDTSLAEKLTSLFPGIKIDFKLMEGIAGQANLEALEILLNPEELTEDTLPHEYAHHYISWFRETPLVQEAIKKWGSEEALVQAIGEQVIKQKGEALDWWEKFTKWVQDLFNNLSNKSKEDLRNILTDAFLTSTNIETGGNITYELMRNRASNEVWNQTAASKATTETSKKNIGVIDNTLWEIIAKLEKRIKILEAKGQDKLSEKQRIVLNNIQDSYKKAEYLQGINNYLETANSSFDGLQEELEIALTKRPEQQSDKELSSSANILNRMRAFINANNSIISDVKKALISKDFKTSELKDVKEQTEQLLKDLEFNISLLRESYNQRIIQETAKFLIPFGWNVTPQHLEEILNKAHKDISFSQTWFDAMSVAGDRSIRLLAKSVEDTKELARLETLEVQQDLITLKKKLEASGIKDTEFMVGRDSKGVQSGNFVTERDWDWFEEEREKFFTNLNKSFNIKEGEKAKDVLSKEDYTNYTNEISRFYNLNTLSYKDVTTLLKRKEKELSPEGFEKWKLLNTQFDPEQDEKYQYRIPIRENSRYKEIEATPIKLEYYNKITDLKVKYEKAFPEGFKRPRQMPQIRRSTIERLTRGDVKGVLSDIRETYQVLEDESQRGTDYGLTDEDDNVVHFLPIYFTRRLKDPKYLSTDITSTMVSFVSMANDRRHMLRIMDNLELAKDVLKNRRILQTSSRGLPLKSRRKVMEETEDVDVTSGETSRAFKRFVEYMEMTVYGIKHVKGKEVAGYSVEKMIDSFGGYTALVQLGLNIYAGINNVNVGASMLRVEAAGAQFFNPKDLFYADGIYTKELPKTLGNVGQRIHDDKIGLWLLKHNTMENFNEEVASLDTERKTMFGQLFGRSAFFFMSHAGEHYIHSKGSIALANNFRFDKKENRFRTKEDFYEPLRLIEAQMRSELSEVKGKEYKNLSKKIKDKYEPKITSTKESLDSQWKEMTNYWDAHEVKNNMLVVKPEFKGKNWQQDHLVFTNLQHSINRQLHGNYGDYAAAIQKYALGRLFMMFHKWIKPYWNRRYQKLYTDDNRQTEVEGYYATVGRFTKQLYLDLKAGQFSILQNWDQLNSMEKANFRKAMTEVAFTIGAAVLATAVMSLKGDDDDDWALNMMAYQANRAFTELGVMTPSPLLISESLKLIREPVAGLSAADDLINMLQFWNWFDEIERGKYAGMYKIERGLIKSIPLAKTVNDWSHPNDKLIFYNTFK